LSCVDAAVTVSHSPVHSDCTSVYQHVDEMSTDDDVKAALRRLCAGLPVNPLPPPRRRDQTMPHAPARVPALDAHQQKVCYNNISLCTIVPSQLLLLPTMMTMMTTLTVRFNSFSRHTSFIFSDHVIFAVR